MTKVILERPLLERWQTLPMKTRQTITTNFNDIKDRRNGIKTNLIEPFNSIKSVFLWTVDTYKTSVVNCSESVNYQSQKQESFYFHFYRTLQNLYLVAIKPATRQEWGEHANFQRFPGLKPRTTWLWDNSANHWSIFFRSWITWRPLPRRLFIGAIRLCVTDMKHCPYKSLVTCEYPYNHLLILRRHKTNIILGLLEVIYWIDIIQ